MIKNKIWHVYGEISSNQQRYLLETVLLTIYTEVGYAPRFFWRMASRKLDGPGKFIASTNLGCDLIWPRHIC